MSRSIEKWAPSELLLPSGPSYHRQLLLQNAVYGLWLDSQCLQHRVHASYQNIKYAIHRDHEGPTQGLEVVVGEEKLVVEEEQMKLNERLILSLTATI